MALKQYINRLNKPLGEVELFDEMIGYFQNQSFAVVVGTDKTHHHNVTYSPLPPYDTSWGKPIEKEISDVFFMVFSPSNHIARMTHLQAKLKDQRWPERNNAHIFSFKLDAGQYHMLHNRLEISDPKGVYPNDILSCPLYSDSVCSYGVFYRDVNNDYDMAYEVASLISNPNLVPYKESGSTRVHSFATTGDLWGCTNIKMPKAQYWRFCHHICRHVPWPMCEDCYPELLSTVQIEQFEKELLDVRVGTRVELDVVTMRQLGGIFAFDQNIFPIYDQFVGEMERFVRGLGLIEEINQYHQIGEDHVPLRGDNQRKFNVDEIGGTYILINADEAYEYIRNREE